MGDRLPWERDGAPAGAGICLSGGGVRAAAFAMGVTQALQANRGLLFGPRSADCLAVVSGGSYLGGALTLNAAARGGETVGAGAAGPPPLADGTPEAEHVVTHGQYLFEGGPLAMAKNFLLPGLVNFAAFVAVFLWVGTMLATYAWVMDHFGVHALSGDPVWLAAAAAVVGLGILLRGSYTDGGARRNVRRLVGFLLFSAAAPSLLASLTRLKPLSDTGWWGASIWRPLGFLVCSAVIAVAWALTWKLMPGEIGRQATGALSRLAVFVPRALGIVLLSLATTAAFDVLSRGASRTASDHDAAIALIAFFAVLTAGVIFSGVANRASLHRPYRDRLAWCFSIRRAGASTQHVPAMGVKLSALAPPSGACERSFPRLLICATANVVWRRADGAKRTFAPFVFSHDRCGIPGVEDASFATTRLEAGTAAAGVFTKQREPLLSLMTGVATTGAAVSPSMGRLTVSALRPFIALANLRLGRWLPNPLSPLIRAEVANADEGWRVFSRRHNVLGGGYDEFVPELLGLQRDDAPRVYVSDGGHYDNLGLLALLAARCETIWCVDSEADKHGAGVQLREVMDLAQHELNVEIDRQPLVFTAIDGILAAGHGVTTISYPGGGTGRLVVVKLGLTSNSSPDLLGRRAVDRHFPYHSTFRYLAFDPQRFNAYRQLGVENGYAAVAAYEAAVGA